MKQNTFFNKMNNIRKEAVRVANPIERTINPVARAVYLAKKEVSGAVNIGKKIKDFVAPSPTKNQNLKSYPKEKGIAIVKGLADGTIKFEANNRGGEYISTKPQSEKAAVVRGIPTIKMKPTITMQPIMKKKGNFRQYGEKGYAPSKGKGVGRN